MSGSASIGGTITSAAGTTNTGPFQPYTVLAANALNAALIYGDKKGGNLDNTPIGQTTPAAGSFTTLTARTLPAGTSTTDVATTEFVATAVGIGGGGGGGGVSLNSPSFTGVPTAPTAAAGNSSTQIATTAFVGNALSNNVVGSMWSGSGSNPGVFRDDGAGNPSTIQTYFWTPINVSGPSSNDVYKYYVTSPAKISGFRIEAPGAGAAGSNSFAMTVTRNGSSIGTTYTGSVSSTSVNALSPVITCAAGDAIAFTVGTITGTIPVIFIQIAGNFG